MPLGIGIDRCTYAYILHNPSQPLSKTMTKTLQDYWQDHDTRIARTWFHTAREERLQWSLFWSPLVTKCIDRTLHIDEMELNPLGQVKSLDQISIDRNRKGYCQTCHIDPIRCFEIRKGVLGILQYRNPLTMPGLVQNGICLRCHPHIAGKLQTTQSNESSRRPSHQSYRDGVN